jgi:hypothetical protein
MGLRLRMPSFKLKVDGAVGREAHLENDDLLPTTEENRSVHILQVRWYSADVGVEHGVSGLSLSSGLVRWGHLQSGWARTLS